MPPQWSRQQLAASYITLAQARLWRLGWETLDRLYSHQARKQVSQDIIFQSRNGFTWSSWTSGDREIGVAYVVPKAFSSRNVVTRSLTACRVAQLVAGILGAVGGGKPEAPFR